MIELRPDWMLARDGDEYVVYRWYPDSYEQPVGDRLGVGSTIEAALVAAELTVAGEEHAEEAARSAYLAMLAAMTPEQRAEHDRRVEQQMKAWQMLGTLLPTTPLFATANAAPISVDGQPLGITWRTYSDLEPVPPLGG